MIRDKGEDAGVHKLSEALRQRKRVDRRRRGDSANGRGDTHKYLFARAASRFVRHRFHSSHRTNLLDVRQKKRPTNQLY